MPDDIANGALTRPRATREVAGCRSDWQLLGHLESAAIGRRAADGVIAVRRRDAAGCFLYGPYLHLAAGRYRLGFRCDSGTPRMKAQPVLGVEIIVLSRFQQAWRDFTAAELSSGAASVDFAVPAEHSLAGGNEGRFEFRFFHFGNADLSLTAVELERLPSAAALPAQPRRWRLLGRLRKGWLGRRASDGGISVRRLEPAGRLLYGGWPYLRLPRGGYRLIVDAQTGVPRRPGAPVLEVEVFGQSRWRSRRPTLLPRGPAALGELQARRLATAEEIAAGPLAVDFVVPSEMALEAGADAPFEVRLRHLGNAALGIRAVDLLELAGDELPAPRASAAPRLRPSAKRKIVLIGNCQCETLRQGFAHVDSLNRRFEVKYHFVQLPRTLHEFAARDLESCDVLLVQDTRLWDAFPLRDCLRPGAEVVRFPPVRFASPWPFDAWNGPGDRAAHAGEAPNLTFPYLDGLLGRLRSEIPDKEARFRAYRSLTCPGVVNYRRLHQLEMRRLAATDKKYAITIGDFISENFASRPIFHTTVRPNWEIFGQLLRFVAKLVGVREPIALPASVDAALRNPQIPVHPKVARDLGIGWADERTRYLNRGRAMTWEAYIRSYIEHYG